MQDPIIRHTFVQITSSFVHLAQYGSGESIIRSSSTPSSYTQHSGSSYSPNVSRSTRSSNSTGNNDNSSSNISASYDSTKKLVIFIPGNPGVLGIYHDFLTSMYKVLGNACASSSSLSIPSKHHINNQITILAISHNNFDHPDQVDYRAEERFCIEEDDLNFVERALAKNYRDDPHHIELQVLNKLIILKRILKFNLEDCKIVFIGHSIGCYIILKLLQDRLLASAHEGSIFIHPALENLALTEKGSTIVRLFNYKLDLFLRIAALALDKFLPKCAKLAITKWYCPPEFVQGSSEIAFEAMMQLVNHRALNALIQMAKSELNFVKNINTDTLIKPHASRLKLIYAINDHWVNPDNRKKLRELYPNLYIEEQSTMHAFIMTPQTVMDYAVKVGMFVQDFMDSIEHGESTS